MTRAPVSDSLRPAAPWPWGALGLLCGLVLAMAVFAPARWLASALAQATHDRVLLQSVRGTVWNGSAQLVIAGGPGSRDALALPSRLAWTMRPAREGWRVSVTASCCTQTPLVLVLQPRYEGGALGWRMAVANGAISQWPAGLLAGLGTPWNTLQLEGRLQWMTRDLVVQRTGHGLRIGGLAEVQALDMSSRLTTLRPLGSYRLRLEGGSPPTLQVTTLAGDLRLDGTGRWEPSGLRFSGHASTAPGREAVLSNLLNIIGRREGARSIITLG